MTLLDLIRLGLVQTNVAAEKYADHLVDCWHRDLISGTLRDVLGLSHREYQAWTTGGVSLLTIARWKTEGSPPLDPKQPWFRISGRPGEEVVGYLDDQKNSKRRPTVNRSKHTSSKFGAAERDRNRKRDTRRSERATGNSPLRRRKNIT
jgi:hypothetical protein